MARIDYIIEKLLKDSGLEIVMETGNGVSIRTTTGLLPVLKQQLTTQQIIGAVAELVPSDQRASFPAGGITLFPYSSPAGAVQVKFELEKDRARVSMVPFAPHAMYGTIDLEEDNLQLAPVAPAPSAPSTRPTLAPAAPAAPSAPVVAPRSAATGRNSQPAIPVLSSQGASSVPAPAAAPAAPPPPDPPPPAPAPAVSLGLVEGDQEQDEARAQMNSLLETMLARRASDLHMSSDTVPHMRIDGDMVPLPEYGPLTSARLKAMVFSIAPNKNKEQWEKKRDTDFAYELPAARFRVNVFADRKGIGSVMRQIPNTIRSAEEMGLSKQILDLCFLTKGLVLVTGPTGSGKSTTLASMVDYINRFREDHIITIEDPIEFVHPNKKCLVNQREIGVHTDSFKDALRAALREDPDVVLVGEMRDLETIAIAIETAETGHLVFGTLHTNTAASTVDRIIDQFPADRQSQIRMMLSESLKGVISQTLCKKIGGGRVAAQEVLLCTSSVSNLIREGKTFQIPSVMQTGRGAGMMMLNDALLELVKKKLVVPTEALNKSVARNEMRSMLERAGFKVETPGEAAASPPPAQK
ncbi:type IV pilus twitching motility protein PilT [Hyalangium minutum]|uniref:Twitching motility protein PilT n=1 Tax=Hyalangium minutum TaxID=394096 RepID=A0A085WSU9_9BACT|nr:type IV pilus twitching motility protein PilT [Hyalangium minutum]KFE70762.1 Twitching motility protein PilT [Hyalangium minutum]